MSNNINLLNNIKRILKDVRFGIFSSRLSKQQFPDDEGFINDFNNMLESFDDREKMLKENQSISNIKTAQLEYLFNMLNDGAMILSEDFKIIAINNIQTKYLKARKRKLLGKYISDILKPYAIYDNSKKIINNINVFFNKEHKNTVLTFTLNEQKSTFSISIKKIIMQDNSTNYFILSKNITPEIKLQELKNTFVATLTHDLKVPILAEKKVLDLLLNDDFKSDKNLYKEAILNLKSNNDDMMVLVSTLLDVYKIENGKFDIEKVTTCIYEVIEKEINKIKFLAEEKNIKILLEANNKTLNVNCDEKQISRVLRNILSNAINYSAENNKILVALKEENDSISITVTDYGCGISKKDIPHIFDRYFTANKKYRKVGTGLGLYLSKKIIDLHGGQIKVESVINKQTTFSVVLPMINSEKCHDKKDAS